MIDFLLEASICLGIFYILYELLFKNTSFFKLNRCYLITSVMMALVIPWLSFGQLPSTTALPTFQAFIPIDLATPTVTTLAPSNASSNTIHWTSILLVIYGIGVGVCSLRLVLQLLSFRQLIHQKQGKQQQGYYQITNDQLPTFSFFNYLFINPKDLATEELDQIIRHEQVHIQQGHSYDVLFFEVLQIIFWFNPFIYLYQKSIKDIHEYLADEGVLAHFQVPYQQYGKLIVSQAIAVQVLPVSNHFSQKQIRKRIDMMRQSKSSKFQLMKYLSFFPVFVLTLLFFANNESIYAQQKKADGTLTVSETINTADKFRLIGDNFILTDENKDKQFEVTIVGEDRKVPYEKLEETPSFTAYEGSFFNYVQANKKELTDKAEGLVQVSFVINADGSTDQIELLKGIGETSDAEAVRLLETMPAWNPAKYDGKAIAVRVFAGIAL